ncbi:hypothetical protein G0Q06_01400 [Puniceicoccales bacterium CK1056]|uniref:Uncharacterized protein n=1 Tax=Oceanipulchritudo coccoides TaxID=2706888 RepID=A0A6B2LX20_9BACT|nr:hypothetical protein [Oceanipulchritudo coccoides]NDV61098.1 hypothetical protein [Oceanipulchritudo coccoides]
MQKHKNTLCKEKTHRDRVSGKEIPTKERFLLENSTFNLEPKQKFHDPEEERVKKIILEHCEVPTKSEQVSLYDPVDGSVELIEPKIKSPLLKSSNASRRKQECMEIDYYCKNQDLRCCSAYVSSGTACPIEELQSHIDLLLARTRRINELDSFKIGPFDCIYRAVEATAKRDREMRLLFNVHLHLILSIHPEKLDKLEVETQDGLIPMPDEFFATPRKELFQLYKTRIGNIIPIEPSTEQRFVRYLHKGIPTHELSDEEVITLHGIVKNRKLVSKMGNLRKDIPELVGPGNRLMANKSGVACVVQKSIRSQGTHGTGNETPKNPNRQMFLGLTSLMRSQDGTRITPRLIIKNYVGIGPDFLPFPIEELIRDLQKKAQTNNISK